MNKYCETEKVVVESDISSFYIQQNGLTKFNSFNRKKMQIGKKHSFLNIFFLFIMVLA